MSAPTYRRHQVDEALWRLFEYGVFSRAPMPGVFATRIKRLLELDRATIISSKDAARWAFATTAPTGTGTEASFSAFDVFCLALALDLLDMGFKQAEIVFLLRHIRPMLRPPFERVANHYPPENRQRYRAAAFPDLPLVRSEHGSDLADPHVYLLVSKVELTEVFSAAPMASGANATPVILAPLLCYGQAALANAFAKNAPRKVLVLEIGVPARLVTPLLEAVPVRTRGRKS